MLARPEIISRYLDSSTQPPLPSMLLRWDPDTPGVADRTWHLPDGVCVSGPAPSKFGVATQRRAANSYRLGVLWNEIHLSWNELTRVQIMTSALTVILRSLGTDLWQMLEQPIDQEVTHPRPPLAA